MGRNFRRSHGRVIEGHGIAWKEAESGSNHGTAWSFMTPMKLQEEMR